VSGVSAAPAATPASSSGSYDILEVPKHFWARVCSRRRGETLFICLFSVNYPIYYEEDGPIALCVLVRPSAITSPLLRAMQDQKVFEIGVRSHLGGAFARVPCVG